PTPGAAPCGSATGRRRCARSRRPPGRRAGRAAASTGPGYPVGRRTGRRRDGRGCSRALLAAPTGNRRRCCAGARPRAVGRGDDGTRRARRIGAPLATLPPTMADPLTLLPVRHGQSEWNAAGLMQGQTPHVPLTALGRTQAESAAEELAGLSPGVLISSDL